MCKILDFTAAKGKAEQTRKTIMKMFEQKYTKEQILDILMKLMKNNKIFKRI